MRNQTKIAISNDLSHSIVSIPKIYSKTIGHIRKNNEIEISNFVSDKTRRLTAAALADKNPPIKGRFHFANLFRVDDSVMVFSFLANG
jgi:hypothetical protein